MNVLRVELKSAAHRAAQAVALSTAELDEAEWRHFPGASYNVHRVRKGARKILADNGFDPFILEADSAHRPRLSPTVEAHREDSTGTFWTHVWIYDASEVDAFLKVYGYDSADDALGAPGRDGGPGQRFQTAADVRKRRGRYVVRVSGGLDV